MPTQHRVINWAAINGGENEAIVILPSLAESKLILPSVAIVDASTSSGSGRRWV